MKKFLNFKLTYFFFCLFFCAIPNKISAQFASSSIGEVAISTGVIQSGVNTGNDINDEFFGGNHILEVTVSDDNSGTPTNAGISWTYDGTPGGYLPFSYSSSDGYLDPDVCLVDDGSTIYAVAVYMSYKDYGGGSPYIICDYVMECFYWTGSTFAPGVTTQIENYGVGLSSVPSTDNFEINIDGGYDKIDECFVITWNDAAGREVRAVIGTVDECAHLCDHVQTIFNVSGTGYSAFPSLPDVAINETYAFFSYLVQTAGGTEIQIMRTPLLIQDGLCSNSLHKTVDYTTSTSSFGEFYNPRIACPNVSYAVGVTSASTVDWAVVAEESDLATKYGIMGVVNYGGTVFLHQWYNDGTLTYSPTDITPVPNKRPVVTYDSNGGILIGWLLDNTSNTFGGNAYQAYYPIALNCDEKGYILAPLPAQLYMNVPVYTSTNDNYNSLSVSGRNCVINRQNLYSMPLTTTSPEVYSKTVGQAANSLRLAPGKNYQFNLNSFLKNPIIENQYKLSESDFSFVMYDLMGREVTRLNGNPAKIRIGYKNLSESLLPGIYMGKINSTNGSVDLMGKLIISQD
jgi:hypothetical protein